MSRSLIEALVEVVHREAHLLDARRWDDWLALYAEDAEFWMPAWTDEHRLGASPDTELSLMYCAARAGLEDRVWRVRSGLSVASSPLPRTVHSVSTPLLVSGPAARDGGGTAAGAAIGAGGSTEDLAAGVEAELHTSWTCHVWNVKRHDQHVFFGRYEHRLRLMPEGAWRIARKKVVLANDRIPTMLDFYCV